MFDDHSDVETLTIKLDPRGHAAGYDIDYVAIEYYPDEERFDFRLELGKGLGIFWALPERMNGPMWLAHVDGAAYTVDEPEVVARPWSADVDLRFEERLGRLRGAEVVGMRLQMTADPMSYRFEIRTNAGDGERLSTLSWVAP